MGEEIEFENGPKWSNFRFHRLLTLTLTLDPGMVITFFISYRVLPVYQISSKSKKLFVDGRTYGRTDGNLPPIVLGRLPKFGSRPKKKQNLTCVWKRKAWWFLFNKVSRCLALCYSNHSCICFVRFPSVLPVAPWWHRVSCNVLSLTRMKFRWAN